ncbi:MAG: carboxylating nicotinate-nucleotide diphosphorylase [Gemmatimonadota bacterium]
MLEAALREDVGAGDVTTSLTVAPRTRGRAVVLTREAGILSGGAAAAWIFHRVEPELHVEPAVPEGGGFEPGDTLLRVRGPLRGILTAERTALNVLQRLSGVATLTRRYVEAVRGTGASILDTRKTTPGWRELERAAVRAGGGGNHRLGLWDAVLVKENHVRAAGGVRSAWRAVAETVGAPGGERDLAFAEIEVRNLSELEEALDAGARLLLLDNFDPAGLEGAVRRARSLAPDAVLEASGGVTLETVGAVAAAGVDRISVGALTHGARAVDMTLLVEETEPPQEGAA